MLRLQQYGHFAAQCSERKEEEEEKKEPVAATTTTIEEFAYKFEREFSLFTLVSSVGSMDL
jgi:hypothetical protein